MTKDGETDEQFGEVVLINADGPRELNHDHVSLGCVVHLLAVAEFEHPFFESCAESDLFESVQSIDEIQSDILDVLDVGQFGDLADLFSHVLPHTLDGFAYYNT